MAWVKRPSFVGRKDTLSENLQVVNPTTVDFNNSTYKFRITSYSFLFKQSKVKLLNPTCVHQPIDKVFMLWYCSVCQVDSDTRAARNETRWERSLDLSVPETWQSARFPKRIGRQPPGTDSRPGTSHPSFHHGRPVATPEEPAGTRTWKDYGGKSREGGGVQRRQSTLASGTGPGFPTRRKIGFRKNGQRTLVGPPSIGGRARAQCAGKRKAGRKARKVRE